MLAILVGQFITEKTNKFEWTFDDIRIEKIILTPIWTKNFFLEVSVPPDVRRCLKL